MSSTRQKHISMFIIVIMPKMIPFLRKVIVLCDTFLPYSFHITAEAITFKFRFVHYSSFVDNARDLQRIP